MRFMLCTVFVLASLLVPNARGQEYGETSYEDNSGTDSETDENNGDSGNIPWPTKFFNICKKFIKDVIALFQDFKAELHKRTKDVVIWSEEMWAGMKEGMNDWINEFDQATEKEKDEMRMYIERLQMPKKSEED